jgi:hypothetical protein
MAPPHQPMMIRQRGLPVTILLDVYERCVIDEASGCWRWSLSVGGDRSQPMVRVGAGVAPSVRGGMQPARRVAWALSGRELQPGWIVYQVRCRDRHCIAPAHSAAGTWSQRAADHLREGRNPETVARSAARARAARQRDTTVPVEVVREIERQLANGVLHREIAAAAGCSRETVSNISRGRHAHQRMARGASVFALGGVLPP